MNKISATLAGLAVVAGASVAPAFAGSGVFGTSSTTPPVGTFTYTGSTYSFLAPVTYYLGSSSVEGTLSLTGTEVGTTSYYSSVLDFTSAGGDITGEKGYASLVAGPDIFGPISATNFKLTDAGTFSLGDRFTLGPLAAPVPEASTVVSFGALLALGGLAFLRRKTAQAAV